MYQRVALSASPSQRMNLVIALTLMNHHAEVHTMYTVTFFAFPNKILKKKHIHNLKYL